MAIGYGKIILFGEHFVVHGIPAIALGISNKAIVNIKKSDKIRYSSDIGGTSPELTTKAIKNVLNAMKIKENFYVHLSGDLKTVGGLGSSAAFCVALVKELLKQYKLKIRNKDINNYAYEGEKAFHGNPSGIDNAIATYGGAIRFIRGKGFEQIKIGLPLHFVIVITGIYSPTTKMVEKVNKFKKEDPEQFQTLCDQMGDIIRRGEKSLASADIQIIGELMNENHCLLKAIGVSIEKNDRIVKIALENGALGAKLTGGGGGGCCIALAKNKQHAQKILESIKKSGFDGFITDVK